MNIYPDLTMKISCMSDGRAKSYRAYRPSKIETVSSFTEQNFNFLLEFWSGKLLQFEKAGCLGEAGSTSSLLSIDTTFDMVGLSAALSWTQSSAIFTYLCSIFVEGISCNIGSFMPSPLPLFHKSHAWIKNNKIIISQFETLLISSCYNTFKQESRQDKKKKKNWKTKG